ncbi:MAG: bacterial Ig-like domain-containing protein [Bacteroidales bacterium]|nr:bacterial Ig-like domain-containing protein [Bacteroidales bacterium]
MRKIFTLLIVAILATATSWAAEYTITFGNKATGATQIQASLKASTAITGGLDYVTAKPFTVNKGTCYYGGGSADEKASVRLGKKNAASSLTIALSETGKVKASSIVVNCKQMNDNSAGGTLAVNGLAAQEFPSSASDLTYTFSEPANITSIKLEATKSVYVYSITVTYTDSPEPQKTVKSLAITGEPTNKEYYVGDAFSADGLKVNATYDDDTQEDVTAKATWAFAPATFTEAGAVSVTATATFGGVSASTTCPVTVKTIANTKETAYTVAEAIKLIDNGKTNVWVYVKGVVSKIVTNYTSNSGVLSFNVSDDAAASQTFLFYRNQKDAENTYAEDPNIEVGATVIGYGILKKYNKTYEFDKGNYLVEYKAPFVPTYTYTWMVNGAEVKKSVLKEGTAVEAPANPENIDDKVFTGWVTTATVDANVVPTYATIDATAKANTTYYAVFATLKQGAGEKWIKKAASEITEEGVYALITKNGNAFNGEIKSDGHGQSTAATFVFDKNNEATSAPEGTCELTFVKKGEGYSIYRDGTEKYKYLYSEASKSGSLKWAVAEQNYWYYDETKGSWAYKVKATETAYLNVYNTNNTFRTYYQAGSTSPVYFAQKVAGTGYADFTTIVKVAEVTTLANLAVNGAEGAAYQVNDEMVVAKKFQKAGKNYIVVKDAAQAVRNFSTPAAGDKFFNINGNKQEEYAQNNWMLVSLPVELYNQVNEENTVTSITGTLTEKTNVAMEATNVVFENATNDFAPNTYCPINIVGASSVKGKNPAYTSSYYFATPKANEYAKVVWAVYDGYMDVFHLPSHKGSVNVQEFEASFYVDYSLNSVDNPELKDGEVYSFEALVKEETVPSHVIGASTKFMVYPLNLDANKVATGVNDVNSAKEVKGVSYFNMMGVESAQPFDGVNIMVTTYTDGTQSAAKVLR